MSRIALALVWVATLAAVEVPEVVTFTADEHASGTNSHLLLGPRSAILVDVPMTLGAATGWRERIGALLAGRKLVAIVITDSHPDHTASLPAFRRTWPAVPILAQPAVIADLRQDGPVYHQRLRARLGDEIDPDLVFPEPIADEALVLDDLRLPLTTYADGHSRHLTTIALPGGRLLTSELVYQGHHLFLRERRIAGWRANLDAVERAAADQGITTFIPSHGLPCGRDELTRMRDYLTVLETAVASGDRAKAIAMMDAAFPGYRMRKFLTDYTLPAYLP